MTNSKIDQYRQEQASSFYSKLRDTSAPIYNYWRDPDNPIPRIGGEPRGISGYPYQGDNALQLAMASQAQGFQSPYWLTFDQAKACGGNIRRGQVSTKIINFTGGKDGKPYEPRLTAYFNADQIQELELPRPQGLTPEQQATRQAGLDALIAPKKKAPTIAQYNERLNEVLSERFPSSPDEQENAKATLRREFAAMTAQARLGLTREVPQSMTSDLRPFVQARPNWRELESAINDANKALADIGIASIVYDKLDRKVEVPQVKPNDKPRAPLQSKSRERAPAPILDDDIPF